MERHSVEPVHPVEHAHPTAGTYIKIAVILAAITLVEVIVYYIEAFRPILLPVFLVLSATKFAIVVMFYMHLKFDSRVFSGFFVAGLLVAAGLTVGFIALFHGLF